MQYNHLSNKTRYAETLPAHGPAPTATRGAGKGEEGRQARRRWRLEETRVSLRTRPIVLILHGVNGHGNESYMRHLAHVVAEVQCQSTNIKTHPTLPNTYIPTITSSTTIQPHPTERLAGRRHDNAGLRRSDAVYAQSL